MAYHNRLAGAGDWSTEYKGGYTPGWGPHVDPADTAAQVVRDKFASRHGSIREAFLCADTNKNGYVDRDELAKLLQLCNLAPDTAEAMLRRFDENGDEEWSYKEFVQALKRKDYNAYQRGSPSPVKIQIGEGSSPGAMPPRAPSIVPAERAFNLFTGKSIHQHESPSKEIGQRYPVAVSSERRMPRGVAPVSTTDEGLTCRRNRLQPTNASGNNEQRVVYATGAGEEILYNRLAGAGDWSTEYKGGYTPGWGPHVDPADTAAQVVRDKFASRHGSIREAFLCADTNKNGYVDRDELAKLLQLCNLAPDTAEAMLRRFDENGDEEWSYKEFVQALKRKDYNAYQRGSPSPVKIQIGEGSSPGAMPPRAPSIVPAERAFNLFTGKSIHQHESPSKEIGQRYPVAVSSERRMPRGVAPVSTTDEGLTRRRDSSRMHTDRDVVALRYRDSGQPVALPE